jgi:hypothetical protein
MAVIEDGDVALLARLLCSEDAAHEQERQSERTNKTFLNTLRRDYRHGPCSVLMSDLLSLCVEYEGESELTVEVCYTSGECRAQQVIEMQYAQLKRPTWNPFE